MKLFGKWELLPSVLQAVRASIEWAEESFFPVAIPSSAPVLPLFPFSFFSRPFACRSVSSLCCRFCPPLSYIVCNGAQRYEQFVQVGRLYRALILLGLALCLISASVSSVLMVLYI